MSDHLHDGHRQRMRERILNGDIEKLQPHEVLEYLLFSFVPRKDTNALAHALIKRFGSFHGVLNTDPSRLCEVKDMTQNAALFLSSLPAVYRVYMASSSKDRTELVGRGAVREYMRDKCWALREERVHAAALDAQGKLIECQEFDRGTGDAVSLNVRDIVDFALSKKACFIIIAHNHPSGSIKPSNADIAVTQDLHYTLSSVGVELLDHYIFYDEAHYSFEAEGLMQTIKNNTNKLKRSLEQIGNNS